MLAQIFIYIQVKYPSFLSVLKKLEFSPTYLRKILKYQFSGKSVQWAPCCFLRTNRWTDRQTDM